MQVSANGDRCGGSCLLMWSMTVFVGVAILSLSLLWFYSAAQVQDPHTGMEDSTDSRLCVECHDGTMADHMINHPFDSDYQTALNSRPALHLAQLDDLPSLIRLLDGRVVCTSCHGIDSTLPFLLRLSMSKSGLCLACHQM